MLRRKEHILVVDDEAPIVRLMKLMLERLGYRVTALVSSTEALCLFEKTPGAFDLVITDMTMPQLTGVQLAGKFRALRPDVPIIMCTGFSEKLDDAARDIGISACLAKPIVRSEMASLVREVLDESAGTNDGR